MIKTIWFKAVLVASFLVTLSVVNTAIGADDPKAAAPVRLAWSPSPGAGAAGYALYYRALGAGGTVRLDVGNAYEVLVPNLKVGSTYIFSVVAYSSAGVESSSSNPIVYSPAALSPLRLTQQRDGTMSVQFRAAPGSLCRVDCTSNLASRQWQALGTRVADADGNVVVNDPPSGRPAVRFYRGVRL